VEVGTEGAELLLRWEMLMAPAVDVVVVVVVGLLVVVDDVSGLEELPDCF